MERKWDFVPRQAVSEGDALVPDSRLCPAGPQSLCDKDKRKWLGMPTSSPPHASATKKLGERKVGSTDGRPVEEVKVL